MKNIEVFIELIRDYKLLRPKDKIMCMVHELRTGSDYCCISDCSCNDCHKQSIEWLNSDVKKEMITNVSKLN